MTGRSMNGAASPDAEDKNNMKKPAGSGHYPAGTSNPSTVATPRNHHDAIPASRSTGRRQFRRDCLPAPSAYYAGQGLALRGRGVWRDALCPFHADTRPSLRVNVKSGAFRCMACGASGGDVLAYHMRRHELRFIDAAKDLGAWEEIS